MRLDVPAPGLLKVEEMRRAESTELLCQGLSKNQIGDTSSINTLLDFLADLPLAMKTGVCIHGEDKVFNGSVSWLLPIW